MITVLQAGIDGGFAVALFKRSDHVSHQSATALENRSLNLSPGKPEQVTHFLNNKRTQATHTTKGIAQKKVGGRYFSINSVGVADPNNF